MFKPRQSITEDQRNWDIQIPLCCMAYRAAVHETTRRTPNFLMLGRELPMPSQLLVATPEEEKKKRTIHQYVQKLENNLQIDIRDKDISRGNMTKELKQRN